MQVNPKLFYEINEELVELLDAYLASKNALNAEYEEHRFFLPPKKNEVLHVALFRKVLDESDDKPMFYWQLKMWRHPYGTIRYGRGCCKTSNEFYAYLMDHPAEIDETSFSSQFLAPFIAYFIKTEDDIRDLNANTYRALCITCNEDRKVEPEPEPQLTTKRSIEDAVLCHPCRRFFSGSRCVALNCHHTAFEVRFPNGLTDFNWCTFVMMLSDVREILPVDDLNDDELEGHLALLSEEDKLEVLIDGIMKDAVIAVNFEYVPGETNTMRRNEI